MYPRHRVVAATLLGAILGASVTACLDSMLGNMPDSPIYFMYALFSNPWAYALNAVGGAALLGLLFCYADQIPRD